MKEKWFYLVVAWLCLLLYNILTYFLAYFVMTGFVFANHTTSIAHAFNFF